MSDLHLAALVWFGLQGYGCHQQYTNNFPQHTQADGRDDRFCISERLERQRLFRQSHRQTDRPIWHVVQQHTESSEKMLI